MVLASRARSISEKSPCSWPAGTLNWADSSWEAVWAPMRTAASGEEARLSSCCTMVALGAVRKACRSLHTGRACSVARPKMPGKSDSRIPPDCGDAKPEAKLPVINVLQADFSWCSTMHDSIREHQDEGQQLVR